MGYYSQKIAQIDYANHNVAGVIASAMMRNGVVLAHYGTHWQGAAGKILCNLMNDSHSWQWHRVMSQGNKYVQNLKRDILKTQRKTGYCKKYYLKGGYGFIACDDKTFDVFVHWSEIKSVGHRSLREGEQVEFEIGSSSDGRIKAINVTGPE